MYSEAAIFDIQHTFSIIEKTANGTDYYNFSSNSASKSINQVYLTNLDMLELFVMYFKNKSKMNHG